MNTHMYIVYVLGNDKFISYSKLLAKSQKCLKVTIQVRAAAGAGPYGQAGTVSQSMVLRPLISGSTDPSLHSKPTDQVSLC